MFLRLSLSLTFFFITITPGLSQVRKPAVTIQPLIIKTARRPNFGGFSIGMSQDSAMLVMRNVAKRSDTLHVDSLILVESDSITLYGQPAFIQLQVLKKRVRTIVINFHPLSGDRYLHVRGQVVQYMEQFYGKGVKLQNESVLYHRWQTEDGTMEVSHSDKYTRVFVRLGKPQRQS
jgi:hypothetical protein